MEQSLCVSLLHQVKSFPHMLVKTDKCISNPHDIANALLSIRFRSAEHITTPRYTVPHVCAQPSLSHMLHLAGLVRLFHSLFVSLSIRFPYPFFTSISTHLFFLKALICAIYHRSGRVCNPRWETRATSMLHEWLAQAQVYVQCFVGVFIILSGLSVNIEQFSFSLSFTKFSLTHSTFVFQAQSGGGWGNQSLCLSLSSSLQLWPVRPL